MQGESGDDELEIDDINDLSHHALFQLRARRNIQMVRS